MRALTFRQRLKEVAKSAAAESADPWRLTLERVRGKVDFFDGLLLASGATASSGKEKPASCLTGSRIPATTTATDGKRSPALKARGFWRLLHQPQSRLVIPVGIGLCAGGPFAVQCCWVKRQILIYFCWIEPDILDRMPSGQALMLVSYFD